MGDDRFRLSGAPPDESYGRVTNPERFQPVVDAARSLIERLSSEYQVSVATTAGGVRLGRRIWGEPGAETVHLSPVEGAPISFVITDFPGVLIRFGHWEAQAFPVCGCDACDEGPDDEVERMAEQVKSLVEGRYEEQLTERSLRVSFGAALGGYSERRLDRGEWEEYGEPAVHRWPPWPEKSPQG